eukprot:c8295_g2_i2.p1 GENE.c8295_g2_i2~~c8295_g2_i2.p1  ORF type:complete len:111 (-),score=8.80 c8295_g2_i2:501-833(-)
MCTRQIELKTKIASTQQKLIKADSFARINRYKTMYMTNAKRCHNNHTTPPRTYGYTLKHPTKPFTHNFNLGGRCHRFFPCGMSAHAKEIVNGHNSFHTINTRKEFGTIVH